MSAQISVVLPVRDAAGTIARAVRSVFESRGAGPDLELVCVDDGSTDATPAELEALAKVLPGLRVIRTDARGIVAALDTGLAHARGPLVARMDADDEMHPERLAAQRERLAAEPAAALVGCQVESFRAPADGPLAMGYRIYSDWVNGLTTHEQMFEQAFVECPVPHPTWMFRAEVVRALGGYRECGWPEDLDLVYRLLASGARLAKIPRALHRWRDHPARLSRTDPRYDRKAFARAKAHFVGRIHPMSGAVVWGAGRTGRRFVRLLAHEGIETHALIDINPARTGTRWHEIPILSPDQIADHLDVWREEGRMILGAVSSRGARPEIRARLRALELTEARDFVMVA